ncbi:hypothetical protein HF086_007032 [Spodoptera exigua]|uniref:Uncharacterized protein n=1 Tax=Spodoptera exigua TaxID=7107 RepID=A0A922M622_SPOEX|nr:hypothetical protein HF086_007032 [Spodoptera exigua]
MLYCFSTAAMRPKKKPKTKEEIKEQKRIAERLRYQRLKNDPVKREQLKEKERRNYQRKKEKVTRSEVVKKALFGEVLNAQLKENYANLKTCQEKQIFGKVVSG